MEFISNPEKKYVNSEAIFKVRLPAYETRKVEGMFLDEEGTKQDGKTLITYKGNTSQEGTPTPSSPINVNVVTGYNKVVVSNKNLLDLSKSEIGAIDSNGNLVINNWNWRATDFIPVKPNTTYTYSRSDTNVSTTLRLYEYDKDFSFISPRKEATTATNTITTKSNTKYLKWVVYQNKTMTIDIIESLNLQIELGDQRTDYIQHQEQSFPISLGSLELCKIGTYQDTIYRQNGMWYLHKEVGKVVLNGSEAWETQNISVSGKVRFRVSDIIAGVGYPANTLPIILSNNYQAQKGNSIWIGTQGIGVSTSGTMIFIYDNIYNTRGDLSAFKTWLGTNNTIVYYVLATPTDTEITNQALISQLEYIRNNLKTYEEETIISQVNSDLPFYLDVLMEI